jgi:uncharacterized protein YabN with tetrapyrrole methylase and pyrophosphatase domain
VALSDLVARLTADLEEFERLARTPGTATADSTCLSATREQLIVVGTGIHIAGQLTMEAAGWMCRAERLFYCVADPVGERVICALNGRAEALMPLYSDGKPRSETYELMVETIMQSVRAGNMTVAAFYGHPGVFAFPSHEVIRRARAERFRARMLPAVSAEDCLFADLGVDPADTGCQSLEASDFLLRMRTIDATQQLVLWQIGVLGEWVYRRESYELRAAPLLARKLLETYPPAHQAIVYEAASSLDDTPRIVSTAIGALHTVTLTPISTLYVPPVRTAEFDLAFATQLPLPVSKS